MRFLTAILMLFLSVQLQVRVGSAQQAKPADVEPRWWKGNLHTHSLWSDGDQFPEMIAEWYRHQGYHFLAITDHNVLSRGIRWMPLKEAVRRSDDGVLERYLERFGNHWVETRKNGSGDVEVRLKPLSEFRHLVEERGRFLLIPGEEISDRAEGRPVHINASNIADVIEPAGGDTIRQAMQNNLRAILEHEQRHGREVLPHVNHPNFGYAITAEDLAAITSERFFEVYNGHPGVNHLGDAQHPSVERIWDLANAIRRTDLDIPPLMGIATDDSHEYHGKPGSRPGRGWIMVRSRFLTPERLIRSIKRGDFYASSGVTLSEVAFDSADRTLRIQIEPDPEASYRTDFIATFAGSGFEERIGVTVHSVDGDSSSYALRGDELYVRAVVTSSLPHADPSYEGQHRQAWTQPVGWRSRNPKSTQRSDAAP